MGSFAYCSLELKSATKSSHNLLAAEKEPDLGDLMQCEDFSDLQRFLRVTAYVRRAVRKLEVREPLSQALHLLL